MANLATLSLTCMACLDTPIQPLKKAKLVFQFGFIVLRD